MRFNSEVYNKLYPRPEHVEPAPESVVSTFHPTKDIVEGKDPDVKDPEPIQEPAAPEPVTLPTVDPDTAVENT